MKTFWTDAVILGLACVLGLGIGLIWRHYDPAPNFKLYECKLMAKDYALATGYFDVYYCSEGVYLVGPNQTKETTS